MKLVDKNSTIPLHIQLMKIIKEMIESGELKAGDSIMPERELCTIQNVSRMTVNKAIVNLVNEDFLYRVQGRGTFVAVRKEKNRFSSMQGFTEVMEQKGIHIKTDILSFEESEQDEYIRKELKIYEKNEMIYRVERLRYIEDEPFGLEISYIPKYICTNLENDLKTRNSLYSIINDVYNHKMKRAEQIIEPIMLTKEESKILKQCEGDLALKLKRTSYIDGDIPVEYTISIFRSDKYQYEITLNA
ncbi:MAG: GntR family transcriptional regulator [Peptostreptococcaceae bacterium]|nr:GntR family transcriptional regulator [Peptostreptococcaceae bacterium]